MSSIPDAFLEGGRFLDEKFAEAVVPVIEVPGFNYLGENSCNQYAKDEK